MKEFTAGRWRIEVTDPSPMWVKFYYDGSRNIAHVTHKDLSDLEYAVQRAIKHCRFALGPNDEHEV